MRYYSKLYARHSPKNKCFCDDGELLYLLPPRTLPSREEGHVFTGVNTKLTSRYGWVRKCTDPFSLEEFVMEAGLAADEVTVRMQHIMLSALSRVYEHDAMAVDYFPRGLPPKLELVVHKVIFHC